MRRDLISLSHPEVENEILTNRFDSRYYGFG